MYRRADILVRSDVGWKKALENTEIRRHMNVAADRNVRAPLGLNARRRAEDCAHYLWRWGHGSNAGSRKRVAPCYPGACLLVYFGILWAFGFRSSDLRELRVAFN